MDSLEVGRVNPSRDLLLLRAGIDDYRYLHSLERALEQAGPNVDADTIANARKFQDELKQEFSLDLSKYYQARAGAYGENWFALPDNPWTDARFGAVRRRTAEFLVLLQKKQVPAASPP
jgi:hypothetical protein